MTSFHPAPASAHGGAMSPSEDASVAQILVAFHELRFLRTAGRRSGGVRP